ncbi:hypothetical protein [Acidicapsa ligni]|uniref:hypothetical protein n=1 Tax=Acidicapsa ligni TaxID=542300 RepID=UPI0021DFFBDC|nr:hypothetical protein [Acidicapsa ligni]
MTATRTQNSAIDHQLILELKIDASGNVTRKQSKLGRKDTLEGKLLAQIYPGIQVARVSVPHELTSYEQSVVENRMAKLIYDEVEYKLVGASGSAKDGKFYFVDQKHAKQIAERFQHWPEAAIVYFAILVSDCKLMIEEPDLNIVVVKDHVLGTNDCRGWVRESLYRKLKIGTNRFCQFRMAFDTREPKQAKGALKAMSDRVADRLGVDVILPESACKPALKGGERFFPQLGTSGRLYEGPAILGIKEVSRESEFGSSYTLVEHASEESLQLEIMPRMIEQIRKVRKAWDEGDYGALLELLGKSEVATFEDDASFDPETLEQDSPASEGWEPAEAVLLADKFGHSIRFPYVANQINRKLARWAFRTCTGGGFRLPSFALADDGILIEYRGKILSASDWIPEHTAITSLTAEKGLCIRYPIRMQEDLLPVRHLSNDELVPMMKQALGLPELDDSLVRYVLERQLRMQGTYILHSETASKNGGDFDFDTICVMPSDRFPKFIAGRIAYGEKYQQEKTKLPKAKSPWWNVYLVAMKARGNRIGQITDLKTSCLAAGRPDLAYRLVKQLQNALDALKHKVEVDEAEVGGVRKEVSPAPWLKYKRERRISDLPPHLEVADTDKVGRLYNVGRKELGFLPRELDGGFDEKTSIEDFRGLFTGEVVKKEMFEECQLVNSIYADVASKIVQREDELKLQLKTAQSHWEAVRQSEDKEQRRAAVLARNKAQTALWEHEQEAKDQFHSLHLFMHYWAQGKEENRPAWVQAMGTVVTGGTGSGAVLFQSFSQEIVDALAELTGGQRVRVRLPKIINGHVRFDHEQRAWLVERIVNPEGPDGEKKVFLFHYKGKRNLVFENTSDPAVTENS